MSAITSLLNQVAAEALRLGIDVDANMRQGATLPEIAAAIQRLPFHLPPDVVELYRWKNGVRLEGQTYEIRMFPRYYLLPLERAVETTEILLATVAHPESQWRSCWFSLFTDLAGDHYAVDVAANHGVLGRIFSVKELVEPFPAFWSLESMIRSILDCYQANAFYLDEAGILTEDRDTAGPIYRRLNHGFSPHREPGNQ